MADRLLAGILDDDDGDDPILSVVNIIDVFLVIIAVLLIVVYIPVVLTMQQITKKDDQRLRQMIMLARMRVRQRAGRQLWGSISYSPIRYKRRKPA